MAALGTVPHHNSPRKSPIGKSGVLTLHGFGIKIRMQSGHLEIEDGVGIERRKIRLARVGHGLKRLVCISEDGFTTLSALKWLADIGVSFTLLNRVGKVLFVTGPTAPTDTRVRRCQALALVNGAGLKISRELIDAKLAGQERVAQQNLSAPLVAQSIAMFRDRLSAANSFEAIRTLEAHAAVSYFAAWRAVPVLWPRADDRKVPNHWRTVGSRHSPLSGGPRLAITPVHAILNYCFGLLEAESRRSLAILGLDPGLGLGLHVDTPNRDSLALDVLEPVRPEIEKWVLSWVKSEPLRRADFYETTTGNCRLKTQLCVKLSETAPTWASLVAPWAEYVARTLAVGISSTLSSRRFPTPLTQQNRREAKARPPFPTIVIAKPDRVCRGCGKRIRRGASFCADCAEAVTREHFDAGRNSAQSREHLAKRASTMRQHRKAIQDWEGRSLPTWLTRELYVRQIQPTLHIVTKSQIRSALGVSEPYSSDIQAGRRIPHQRHWQTLAALIGLTPAAIS